MQCLSSHVVELSALKDDESTCADLLLTVVIQKERRMYIKAVVFWDVTSCLLVNSWQRFGGA
jgi:hypothetical protein